MSRVLRMRNRHELQRRHDPWSNVALPFFLAASLAGWGCTSSPDRPGRPDEAAAPESPRSIVIVSIDTLRADHLGCYGYFRDTSPAIDGLATESIVFERALAPMSMTLPSHTSLLTGTYPLEHGVLANIKHGGRRFVPAPGLRSFAEFARDRGYQTAGFVSAAPLIAATGIAAGFDVFVEPPDRPRSAEETNEEVYRWIDGLQPEPFLLFVHYFDPHAPYRPPEDFRRFDREDGLERYLRERRIPAAVAALKGRVYDTRESTNLYDGEVRYVDDQVGRLVDRLRQAGRWDDTALILISDHGESIGDHGLIGHEYITREQLHSLMMLRIPGSAPRRVATPISIVDTLPTAIGVMGHEGWEDFLAQASGRDALAASSTPHPVFAQRAEKVRDDFVGPAFTLLAGNWHYVHEPERGNRLYDWSVDPFELDNVIEQHPDVAKSLEKTILERVGRYHARGAELRGDSEALGDLDPELTERLRALGYVGG